MSWILFVQRGNNTQVNGIEKDFMLIYCHINFLLFSFFLSFNLVKNIYIQRYNGIHLQFANYYIMCIYDFLLVCSSITLSRWGSLLFVVLNLQNKIASFISKIFKYSSYLNSVLKILLFIALGELCNSNSEKPQ